jgi:Tol biopolymer transport system component
VWNIYWVSREGGAEQQITRNTSVSTFLRYPAWSPAGDRIVYEVGEVRGNVWLLTLP